MSRLIPPQFGPASGWFRPERTAPGSLAECQGMRQAALPCIVTVLRRRGARILARELMDRGECHAGLLLCLDRYTSPNWHACLFKDDAMREEVLPRLLQVHLTRENEGVRLYHGIQVEERVEYPQSWLCTPSLQRAREILMDMVVKERQTGSTRPP